MAVLKIAKMGHPVLSEVAEPVKDPTDSEIHRLVGDMIDTMRDAPGVGLAAPQVHVPLRIVVFYVPGSRSEDDGVPLTVLINPEIKAIDDDRNEAIEGCLSLPQMAGSVSRFTNIRYKALTLDGSTIEREASGFHARVVQHECDHLDGILYPMRMDDLSSFGYTEELAKGVVPEEEGNAEQNEV
jgi:peptide deformylase